MLYFFRRIRRKLLHGGKLKKYLLYAFGEVFLVIIGILIALQVNNWNEARKTSAQAEQLAGILYQELLEFNNYHDRFYNQALKEELDNTECFLKNWSNLNRDSLLKFRETEFKVLKSRNPIVGMHGFQFFYDPEFPFYKAAFNDGTLSLINDKEFVNLLSEVYSQGSERMNFFETNIGKVDIKTQQHILEHYHTIFAAPEEADGGPWNDHAYDAFFDAIKTDNQLRYLVSNRHALMTTKKYILESQIINNIDKAIELYDEAK